VLGPSLTAKLGERAIGGAVGGITEAVTQPEFDPIARDVEREVPSDYDLRPS
jgi:hypothetical protein